MLGQSLEAPQHRAHIQVSFKNSQSPHTPQHRVYTRGNFENSETAHATAQGPYTWECYKLNVLTHHSTELTHMGTLKTQSSHMPNHGAHTHSWELKVLTHHSTGTTHRGTLKNLKVSTHHSIGPTHRNFLRFGRMTVPSNYGNENVIPGVRTPPPTFTRHIC